MIKIKSKPINQIRQSDCMKDLFMYQRSKNYDQNQIIVLIIMGIFCRKRNLFVRSNLFFKIICKIIETNTKDGLFRAFLRIYRKLVQKKRDKAVYLQFFIIEILQKNPLQALQSYLSVKDFQNGSYDLFLSELINKIQKSTRNIRQIIIYLTSQKNNQKNLNKEQKQTQKKQIINMNLIKQKIDKFLLLLAEMKQLEAIIRSKQKLTCFENAFFNQILQQVQLMKTCIKGLQWSPSQIYNSLNRIQLQINQSQQALISTLDRSGQLLQKQGSFLLTNIIWLVEQFFENEFPKYQLIKLIINSLAPYLPICQNKNIYDNLGHIFDKFNFSSANQHQIYQQLQQNIRSLFDNINFPQKQQTEQRNEQNQISPQLRQMEQQMTITSKAFGIDEEDQLQFRYVKRRADSWTGPPDNQADFFNFKDEKVRKYSYQQPGSNQPENISNLNEQLNIKHQQRMLRVKIINEYQLLSQASNESDGDKNEQNDLLPKELSNKQRFGAENISNPFIKTFYLEDSDCKCNFNTLFNFPLYRKFNRILFNNAYAILHYLSHNNQALYIAKHQLGKMEIKSLNSFSVDIQKGVDWASGSFIISFKQLIKWICDVSLGVAELEELGIYHADLAIRNTIRVGDASKPNYKIIDFNKAFKVIQTGKDDEAYQCTKQLLTFWLNFYFNGNHSQEPFDAMSLNESSSGLNSSQTHHKYTDTDIIDYIFLDAQPPLIQELKLIKSRRFSKNKLDNCLQKLQQHMRVSHRQQLSNMIKQKLLNQLGLKQKLKEDQICNDIFGLILKETNKLTNQDIDIHEFVQKIKLIGQ